MTDRVLLLPAFNLLPHPDISLSRIKERLEVFIGKTDIFNFLNEIRYQSIIGNTVIVDVEDPVPRFKLVYYACPCMWCKRI